MAANELEIENKYKEMNMKYFMLASLLIACEDKENDSAESEEVVEESEESEESSEESE